MDNRSTSVQLSSNWTLFFKIVLPTIWTVFFGAFALAFMFTENARLFGLSQQMSILTVLAFFLIGFTLLYFTLMGLKRVEIEKDSIVISNYFKTYRIPYSNIQDIKIENYSFFKLTRFHFMQPISFGSNVYCLANSGRLQIAIKGYPSFSGLLKE